MSYLSLLFSEASERPLCKGELLSKHFKTKSFGEGPGDMFLHVSSLQGHFDRAKKLIQEMKAPWK